MLREIFSSRRVHILVFCSLRVLCPCQVGIFVKLHCLHVIYLFEMFQLIAFSFSSSSDEKSSKPDSKDDKGK